MFTRIDPPASRSPTQRRRAPQHGTLPALIATAVARPFDRRRADRRDDERRPRRATFLILSRTVIETRTRKDAADETGSPDCHRARRLRDARPCGADLPVERRQPQRSRRSRAGSTIRGALAFLPDGKMLVTERPGRLRIVDARRQAVAAGDGRAAGARLRPGRPARRRARPRLRRQPDDLFLLRRARLRRRAHRDGARALHRRRGAAARRREGDLPPGRPAVERQSLWLPHRAGPRRQSVAHHGRPLHLSRRGAEPRQPPRQDRARDAGRRGAAATIRSSAATTPSRRSGATAIATRRARRCIRRPASCGSTSTARAAATRSTFRSPARTTAGR